MRGKSDIVKYLPSPQQLNCCWQKMESIEARFAGEQSKAINLLGVIVRQDSSLLVNLLSAEGQQLLRVRQGTDGFKVEHFVEQSENLPVELILMGIYLSYSEPDQWAAQKGVWEVELESKRRSLMLNKKNFLTLIDRSSDHSWSSRRLVFSKSDLVLNISLLEHKPLSKY